MVRLRDAGRFSKTMKFFGADLGADALHRLNNRQSRRAAARSRLMLIDALENRVLLSTLPVPVTAFDTNLTGPTNVVSRVNYSSPSVSYDPTNPMRLVEASVEDVPNATGDQKVFIQLSYSTNGGASWNNVNANLDTLPDPTTTTQDEVHFFVNATDPSVAFDRLGNFYLTYAEYGSGNTSGVIVLDKFDFNPANGRPETDFTNHVVYQWITADSEVMHPTIAVDTNLPSYTSGGVTLTDPTVDPTTGQGPVYIGWATNFIIDQMPPGYNPNAIQVVMSSDGGENFGPATYLNNNQNFGFERDTYPRLVVSQGTLATDPNTHLPLVEPGQLTAVWDDFGTGINASPPYDNIASNHFDVATQTPYSVGGLLVDPNDKTTWKTLTDAVDLATSPDTYGVVDNAFRFTMNVPADFVYSDMSVELAMVSPSLDGYEIMLEAPDGTMIDLVQQSAGPAGMYDPTTYNSSTPLITNTIDTIAPAQGVTGTSLGVKPDIGAVGIIGTTFNDNAPTGIHAGDTPYTGTFQPEGGSLAGAFGSFAAADFDGTWTLHIVSYVPDTDANITPTLEEFRIGLTSALPAGQSNVAQTFVNGALSGPFPINVPSSPGLGVGAAPVIASDNTMGAYSQFAGRLYVAYVTKSSTATTNTDIALAYSDDGGNSWGLLSGKVNDDLAVADGYSGSVGTNVDRSQFEPAIAVDQANGTLVMTWYDARYDAADARVARFITTSIDGGGSFGAQTYLNQPNQVYDAISGQATNLGPIPDNFSAGNPASMGQFFEGTQQGLAVFDGRVYAVWTGNQNAGVLGKQALDIYGSTTTYASGPRVISSTQGVVSTPEDIVNPAQNIGGLTGIVPAFQYIDVQFDRPIAPDAAYDATANPFYFPASAVDIQYRDDNTPGTQPPTDDFATDGIADNQIVSIVPLNEGVWGVAQATAATEFRIKLAAPQTRVGTYSYSIQPVMSDGYEYLGAGNESTETFTASDAGNAANTPNPQFNLTVPALGSNSQSSQIAVPVGDGLGKQIVGVNVNVQFDGPIDALSLFSLYLISPSGARVPLALNEVGAAQGQGNAALTPNLAGHGYVSTTFDNESPQPIADGNFQFSGTYRPAGNLAAFDGLTLNDNDLWTLQIVSNSSNSGNVPVGMLHDWSVQFTTATLTSQSTAGGDFNGDGTADSIFVLSGLGTIAINLGGDSGTFATQTDGSKPLAMVASDFNTDGVTDLAVTTLITNGPNAGTPEVWLLTGNGDGTFNAPTLDSTLTPAGTSAVSADFNGDGVNDQAVLDPTTGKVVVLLNYQADTDGSTPYGVQVADFDADGNLDLEVFTTSGTWFLQGNGGGGFAAPVQVPGPAAIYTGNFLDQNTDAIGGQSAQVGATSHGFGTLGDVWAMPAPTSALALTTGGGINYFAAPYQNGTSGIVVPGPSLTQAREFDGPGSVAIPNTAGTTTSQIVIGGNQYDLINKLIVKLNLSYTANSDLVVTLLYFAPGTDTTDISQAIPITLIAGTNGSNFGDADLGPTVFADDANGSIAFAFSSGPYVGLYKPVTPLADLTGHSLAGTWQLQIQNVGATATAPGTLNSWAIVAQTQTAPTDQPLSSMVIHFDRNMDPASVIAAAANLTMVGPLGPVAGPFTITADPGYDSNFPDPDADHPRTYEITFPQQTLTGTYVLSLPGTITDQNGIALDSDQNAGVDKLNDAATATTSITYGGDASTSVAINPRFTGVGLTTSTITVPVGDGALIQGITLTLHMNYPRASELSAVLISPTGQAIQLFGNLPSNGKLTGQDMIFSDAASVSIDGGAAPYFGTYSPEQPMLSSLLNTNSTGVWTLQIKNNGLNAGTLVNWSMDLTVAAPNSGTGATAADTAKVRFNLFNLGATDPQSHEVWTPVGGSAINTGANSSAGPVTAIGVDPSDPSGNTVYIGAATGGIWRTTNFLTTDPQGPTYVPLTDFAPTNGLNIGSIAVLGSQKDPSTGNTVPSMIFAATGEGDSGGMSPGIGILVSTDGGQTWNLATGLTNTDTAGNWLGIGSAGRDNMLVGTTVYKIVVDPHLQPNGNAIIYLAASDPAGTGAGTTYVGKGGIYRSIDSGKTWQLMRAGQATDIMLDLNSGVPNFTNSQTTNPTQNVNAVTAAFAGEGVFRSTTRGVQWNQLLGDIGVPTLLRADQGGAPPVALGAMPSPSGDNGRIVLASPALTGDPVKDVLYEGWTYAAVISNANGGPYGKLVGLYMTKDYGQTWTRLEINTRLLNGAISQNPTNDTTDSEYSVTNGDGIGGGDGNYAVALAVDPSNPNVVYFGGSTYANGAAGMIRIDTTGIADSHAFYQGENAPDGGAIRDETTDVNTLYKWPNHPGGHQGPFTDPVDQPVINLLQNPSQPFGISTTVALDNVTQTSNSGANITWLPFDAAFGPAGATPSEYHRIIAMPDPQTGMTRLIIATDQGVYSAVDQGDGTFRAPNVNNQGPSGVTGTTSLNEPLPGSRNGNLQIAELYYGAVQPSQAAANAAGSLFYGEGQGAGLISSPSNVLTSGNTGWSGPVGPSGGTGVATDQTGTGTVYDYTNPFWGFANSDFFQVNGVGRTTGLLTSTTGPTPTHDAQWPAAINQGNQNIGSNFAVNPVNGNEIVISSQAFGQGAQIFSTENQGRNWSVIATPADFDGSYAPALAYGAPTTGQAVDTFIYAGTTAGHIYVTFTGGGSSGSGNSWIDISAGLDGSAVQSIVTDPNHGMHDAFAVTAKGVYYMADSSAPDATWSNITGSLATLAQTALGSALYTAPGAQSFTALSADWRYANPVLYVGANAGVYRGVLDGGAWTWEDFPNAAVDGAPADGGYLPNVKVSDLDLSVGNVDPTTGLPHTVAGDPNVLVASTFGRGAFAIRLAPIVSNVTAAIANPALTLIKGEDNSYITNSRTFTISGSSERQIAGFNHALISIYQLNSNGTRTFLGGYDPTDSSTSPADPHSAYFASNIADASGNFTISTTTPLPNVNGNYTIGIQATDNAGVTGAYAKLNVALEVTPPVITSLSLTKASDSGTSNTDNKTNISAPMITGQGAAGATVTIYVNGTSAGTTTADGTGLFNFTLPAQVDGTYTISASEVDALGNQSATPNIQFTLVIATSVAAPDAPKLAAGSDTGISTTDGVTNQSQPTFTGALPSGDAGNMVTLTITPASGTPITQTVTSDSTTGVYSFTLSSPLTDGVYSASVTQTDVEGNTSAASASTSVTIDTTDPEVFVSTDLSGSQFGEFTGVVATYTDTNGNGSVTVDWGDGTTNSTTDASPVISIQNVSGDTWQVIGSHAYQSQGNFTVTVVVTDQAGNIAAGSTGTFASGAPAIAVTAQTVGAVVGKPFTGTIATFMSGITGETADKFTVSVDWGDGTPLDNSATITQDPNNALNFFVTGTHTYPSVVHTYSVTVTVNSTDGSATQGTAISTLQVQTLGTFSNVQPIAVTPANEGALAPLSVATITGSASFGGGDFSSTFNASDFTATIDWGDGATSTGSIAANGAGGFTISGSHAFADGPATDAIVINVYAAADNSLIASVTTAETVNNVPPTVVSAGNGTVGLVGQAYGLPLNVTDPGTVDAAHGFIYNINWGDGSAVQTITATANNGDAIPTHSYTAGGSYTVSVTATDKDGGVSNTGTASVQIASLTSGTAITTTEGTPLVNQIVATVVGAGANASFSNISVNWGDGTTDTLATGVSVVADSAHAGNYFIEDSHTYADNSATPFTVSTTISAAGGSGVSVQESATVANAPPVVQVAAVSPAQPRINQNISISLVTTDPGSVDAAHGFAYTIDWGDGSAAQTIAATANNGAGLSPTHAYTVAGNYTITVTAADKDGGKASTTKAVQIAPAPTLSDVVINGGSPQRTHITSIDFTISSTLIPVTSLDASDLILVRDGSTNVPLTGAVITFNPSTGQAHIDMSGVTLADGDYELFVFPDVGVLPIQFSKTTGDVNGDGIVNHADKKAIKADIGTSAGQAGYDLGADLNGDGKVDSTDLALLQIDHGRPGKTKVIKLLAGKKVHPPKLHFKKLTLDGTRAFPVTIKLENIDPSRTLTVSDLDLSGGNGVFSFSVPGQAYGATSFSVAPGGSLTVNVYFTPTSAGVYNTKLMARFSNGVSSNYGPLVAQFKGKAVAPRIKKLHHGKHNH